MVSVSKHSPQLFPIVYSLKPNLLNLRIKASQHLAPGVFFYHSAPHTQYSSQTICPSVNHVLSWHTMSLKNPLSPPPQHSQILTFCSDPTRYLLWVQNLHTHTHTHTHTQAFILPLVLMGLCIDLYACVPVLRYFNIYSLEQHSKQPRAPSPSVWHTVVLTKIMPN